MKNIVKNKKAFTLIELLVVVLIIGILAAIAVPKYQVAVAKSRAVEGLTLVKSLRPAIDEYVLTHGTCPVSFNDLSLLPVGNLSKYSIQDDALIGEYYYSVLIDCRLDIGQRFLNGYTPSFLYQVSESKSLPAFRPGNIYCYYRLEAEEHTDVKDSICKSLSNSDIIEYSERGRAYKM